MKKMTTACLSIVFFLLAGCETSRVSGTEGSEVTMRARSGWVRGLQLEEGMSLERVVEAIGEPQRRMAGIYEDEEAELLVYSERVRESVDADLIQMEQREVLDPVTGSPRTIEAPARREVFEDRIRVTQLIFVDSSLVAWNHR